MKDVCGCSHVRQVMIAGGAILDKSGNSWIGIDITQNRMFESGGAAAFQSVELPGTALA